MNKIIIALLVSTLLISGLASAQDDRLPLNPPPGYYGTVTVNGQPAPAGTTITAKIGGEERGSIKTTQPGVYGDNPGPAKLWIRGYQDSYQNEIGSTITFYVKGVAAEQTAKLSAAGSTSKIDLSFVGVPVSTVSGGASGGSSGAAAGGGESSSGVNTEEPSDNILKYLTIYGNLIANTPVAYNFSSVPEFSIYEISIVGTENESNVPVRLELLKGTSKLVKAPPEGTVYKNKNIWAGTKKFKEALIKFRVENSWITSGGIASSDVRIYRWDGSRWNRLDTTEASKDASYTYYEAKTNAFSPFAISGLKGAVAETPGITPEATEALKVSSVLPSSEPAINLAIIFGAIIALISIVAVLLYFRRK